MLGITNLSLFFPPSETLGSKLATFVAAALEPRLKSLERQLQQVGYLHGCIDVIWPWGCMGCDNPCSARMILFAAKCATYETIGTDGEWKGSQKAQEKAQPTPAPEGC